LLSLRRSRKKKKKKRGEWSRKEEEERAEGAYRRVQTSLFTLLSFTVEGGGRGEKKGKEKESARQKERKEEWIGKKGELIMVPSSCLPLSI